MKKTQDQTLKQLIRETWERHAQHAHLQWPAGMGGYIAIKTPEKVMSPAGFEQAALELVKALIREPA